jgi:thiosulfate/3-mercaptopyruvate sulfurtransferase
MLRRLASAGKPAIVECLLRAGADAGLESLDGFTAPDMAATIECLGLLRTAYRKPSVSAV